MVDYHGGYDDRPKTAAEKKSSQKHTLQQELNTIASGAKQQCMLKDLLMHSKLLLNPRTMSDADRKKYKPIKGQDTPNRNYDHARTITGAQPETVLNQLLNVPSAREFLTISKELTSTGLSPQIDIYKVIKKRVGSAAGKEVKIPFTVKPGSFVNSQMYFKARNQRGADIGLLEVNVKMLAMNPAEINSNLEVNIKFQLSSMAGLKVVRNKVGGHSVDVSDMIKRKSLSNGNLPQILKLVVGWTNPLASLKGFSKDIRRTIMLQRFPLFLELRDHELEFDQGTSKVVISATYNAHMQNALMSPTADAFGLVERENKNKTKYTNIQKLEKEIAAKKKDLDKKNKELKRVAAKTRDPKKDKKLKSLRKQLKEAKLRRRQQAAASLTNKLLTDRVVKTIHIPTEFFAAQSRTMRKKPKELKGNYGYAQNYSHCSNVIDSARVLKLMNSDWQDRDFGSNAGVRSRLDQKLQSMITKKQDKRAFKPEKKTNVGEPSSRAKSEMQLILQIRDNRGKLDAISSGERSTSDANLKRLKAKQTDLSVKLNALRKGIDTSDDAGKMAAITSYALAGGAVDTNDTPLMKLINEGFTGNSVIVQYIHFGDILETVMALLKHKGTPFYEAYGPTFSAAPTIVYGPVVMETRCGDNIKYTNIANVPVELSELVGFLINHIVKPDRHTYPLMALIHDLMNDLLPRALGINCADDPNNFNIRPRIEFMTVNGRPKTVNGKIQFLPPVVTSAGAIDVANLNQARSNVPLNTDGGSYSAYDYIVLYVTSMTNNRLRGNRRLDESNGIYHLKLPPPATSDVIRTWTFSKTDQPYLAEAKVFGGGDIGDRDEDISGGAVYNLKIKMLGNGFFRPGQLVFVDVAGLEIDPQLAVELNLGGYFLVVEVEMNIINGKFTTDIELQWQGHFGFGKPEPKNILEKAGLSSDIYSDDFKFVYPFEAPAKGAKPSSADLASALAAGAQGSVTKGLKPAGHGTKPSQVGTKKAPTYTSTAGPAGLQ